MSDVLTSEQRHLNMSRIRSTNTGIEKLLRSRLQINGFRFRINVKDLPGKPDIVLPKYHTVIFVHGCFWHGHKDCKKYTVPKTNTEFWRAKVARNQERDQEVWRKLEGLGWAVIIVWECELKKAHLAETVDRVSEEIRRNGDIFRQNQAERRRTREEYRAEQKARQTRETAMLTELNHLH